MSGAGFLEVAYEYKRDGRSFGTPDILDGFNREGWGVRSTEIVSTVVFKLS